MASGGGVGTSQSSAEELGLQSRNNRKPLKRLRQRSPGIGIMLLQGHCTLNGDLLAVEIEGRHDD